MYMYLYLNSVHKTVGKNSTCIDVRMCTAAGRSPTHPDQPGPYVTGFRLIYNTSCSGCIGLCPGVVIIHCVSYVCNGMLLFKMCLCLFDQE